jgi:hypothetical protein
MRRNNRIALFSGVNTGVSYGDGVAFVCHAFVTTAAVLVFSGAV